MHAQDLIGEAVVDRITAKRAEVVAVDSKGQLLIEFEDADASRAWRAVADVLPVCADECEHGSSNYCWECDDEANHYDAPDKFDDYSDADDTEDEEDV